MLCRVTASKIFNAHWNKKRLAPGDVAITGRWHTLGVSLSPVNRTCASTVGHAQSAISADAPSDNRLLKIDTSFGITGFLDWLNSFGS